MTDPSGDQTGTVQQDIQSVSVAQPYDPNDGTNKVYITLKVASLSPLPQPSSRWITYFTRIYRGLPTEWFVAMRTDAPASATVPAFVFGHTSGSGTSRQLFFDGPADSGSFSLDGTITIVLSGPRVTGDGLIFDSLISGEGLFNVEGQTQTIVAGATATPDATGKGSYRLTNNDVCAPAPTPAPTATPAPSTSPAATPQARLSYAVARLAADPVRPRVYATVPTLNSVIVIDTIALTVIKTIAIGSLPRGLVVSGDGSKLWVANSGSTASAVGVIDLNSLSVLPSIPAPHLPFDLEEGLGHRLYLTPVEESYDGAAYIMQVNADTGAYEGSVGTYEVYRNGFLRVSPDHKTLFFGNDGLSPSTLDKFDISAVKPVKVQQNNSVGSNGLGLTISHDGTSIVYPNGGGNGSGYNTFKIPAKDIQSVDGSFAVGAYPGPAAFSNDDTLLYHTRYGDGEVAIFDTRTFQAVGHIPLNSAENRDVVVDRSGKWLFVSNTKYDYSTGEVQIYATGRSDPATPRSTPGPIATPTASPSPTPPAQSQNISTRLNVLTGDNVLIGGFIITGNAPKKVVIRAIGPSVPVEGALRDPILELHLSDGSVLTNDNWKTNDSTQQSQENEVRATNLPPSDDRESALVVTLAPGSYTSIVRGKDGTTGIGLIELYDAASGSDSSLANIASRGFVDSGNNVMIGGFIIGPQNSAPTKVAVRAIGPSLPLDNALQDPVLELHDGNGAVAAMNDNWQDDSSAGEIRAYKLDPKDTRECAMARTLIPGAYSAIVRGANEGKGVGLVEVYNLR